MSEHQQTQQPRKPNSTFQKQAILTSQNPVSHSASIIQRARINPKSLTSADVLQLQRTIGNRAVGRLLSEIRNPSKVQQATVQRQEIPEEEEPLQGKMIGIIQRQEIPEEEEPLQGKFKSNSERATCPSCSVLPIIQKQEIPEEEEPLQGKMIGTIQRQEIPEEEEPLQTKKENNTGMPNNLKAGVESLSGIDMSDVRVHYDSDKPAKVEALAYTQGTNIYVAPGQERHLPHEAWHVVQQIHGRVKPTMQAKGVSINDDATLEREADVMGAKAATNKRPDPFSSTADKRLRRERDPEATACRFLQAVSTTEEATDSPRREATEIQRRVIQAPSLRPERKKSRAVIQRDVGFEYETTADTYLAGAPLTLPQRQTPEMPDGWVPLAKGDVLVANMGGLHAKADEGGVHGSNLELETDHFPETAAGRLGLHQALKNLERFCRLIDAHSVNQPHFASPHLAAAFGGAPPVANRYVRKANGTITGNPQATVGVLLSRIEQLMERTVGYPNVLVGHPPLARIELGLQGGAQDDFFAVGNSPDVVRRGINAYILAHGGGLPVGFPSDRLIGLCSLMYSYINIGAGLAKTYAKQIAPLMARTDFGSMFGADIPGPESGFLSAGGGAEFVNMWTQIVAAGVGGGLGVPLIANEPLVTRGLGLNISGNLTRLGWIMNVSQGIDQLTSANFPSALEQPHLFGLGGLGGGHDAGVGPAPGANAPIFELRRMMNGMHPHDFTEVAMGVFDYIVGLNNAAAGAVAPAYGRVARPAKSPKFGQKFNYWWAGGR
ncbi:MAG: DUF4157 domain-containing protein [Methanosarcina sp.]